ncbi:MAG: phosphatase PAP2 family protein, partial [Lewinella sp.]|nr:phosphatase PAP2 family protein [Lewinella sp.]
MFKRPRPYAFSRILPGMISEQILLKKNTLRSFFSGHTSIVACNSFMAAKMLTDFYPESKVKPIIWTTATLLPAITGYLRVKAGKHFITDVLAGLAAGAAVGLL